MLRKKQVWDDVFLIETISLILGVFWAGKTEVEKAQEAAEFLEEPTKLK